LYFSPKDMLNTAVKVVSLIMLLQALKGFIELIPLMALNHEFTARWEVWQVLLSFISPLALLIIGLFMLRYANRLTESLWKTDEPESEAQPNASLFQLAVKITGLILIVFALPQAVQILGNILYIKSISGAISTVTQNQFVFNNLLSALVSLLFGSYLLCGGRLFYRMAFPGREESDNTL